MNEIKFYRVRGEKYGAFSNFSPHSINIKGKIWPTSEHYFQAQKHSGTPREELIRNAKSPREAADLGRDKNYPIREDWEDVKDDIMFDALYAKFTQHDDLNELLRSTGNAILIEHTKNDSYWGDGGDGSGKNVLGNLLMVLRQKLFENYFFDMFDAFIHEDKISYD